MPSAYFASSNPLSVERNAVQEPEPDPITEHEDFYQNTHRLMSRLRAESPVHRTRLGGEGSGYGWLVTRYEDVKIASSAPEVGRDGDTIRRLQRVHSGPERTAADDLEDEFSWLYREVLYMDPPDHTRLRKVANKAFTPGAIGRLRPRIEQLADGLLDKITGPGAVDLMPAVAVPLPLIVICELLGVPEHDRPDFTWWANVINSGVDEDGALAGVYREVADYLGELVERKRATPGDDLMSHMVRAMEAGVLSREEVISMAVLMLIAGHDTTVSLIGNGVLELLRAPDQLALLRSDLALLPNAVEEMLRYACPVNISATRFTREPVELGGARVPAGELLYVSILSANRDASQFENPDVFDITRKISGHVGFGHGIHYCLGAPLARLETQIVLRGLLDRFPGLRLAVDPGTLEYRKSTLMHVPATLPVYTDRGDSES
jgi:cytochrome P450